ncbi:putative inactive receptor kinase [Abeliophyllum distichum]|uniref:Inactive receptor kinase n=1 Tax=Abeliophyllum distichum TaxID=126358 RepID=A0ABD1VCD7_9LAMI
MPEKKFRQHMEVIGYVWHENVSALRAYYFSKDEKLMVHDHYNNGKHLCYVTWKNWRESGSIRLGNATKNCNGCSKGIAHTHKQSGGKLVHPFQATRKKKTSLLNTIPSTRLLNNVQNLVEKNSFAVHGKEDTHSYSCTDSLKKWMNDSGAVLSQ